MLTKFNYESNLDVWFELHFTLCQFFFLFIHFSHYLQKYCVSFAVWTQNAFEVNDLKLYNLDTFYSSNVTNYSVLAYFGSLSPIPAARDGLIKYMSWIKATGELNITLKSREVEITVLFVQCRLAVNPVKLNF